MSPLRDAYLRYLADYGLTPREVPPNVAEMQRAVVEAKKADALSRGDRVGAELLQRQYDEGDYASETRHPAEVQLDQLAAWAREAIATCPIYAASQLPPVHVGEFPTGAVNALSTRVDEGCLILVNSGMFVLTKQVCEVLVGGDLRSESGRSEAVSALAAIMLAFVVYGDPMLGPLPLSGGLEAMIVHQLTVAVDRFVIAHEFGHLLAGHLDETEWVPTRAGEIEVIRKSFDVELTADRIGHELMLGVSEPALVTGPSVLEAEAVEPLDVPALLAAADRSLALIAPLVLFEVEQLIAATYMRVHSLGPEAFVSRTHPPAQERGRAVVERLSRCDRKYLYYLEVPFRLRELTEAVVDEAAALAPMLPPAPAVGALILRHEGFRERPQS